VQAELDACKKADGARPDAYFNEGILTQEYKAKNAGGTDQAVAVYLQAKQIFQTFQDKANGKPEYAGALKKTTERMQDIDDTVTFLKAGGPPSAPPPAPSDSSAAGAPPSGSASASASAAPSGGAATPPATPPAKAP
jgi:hypothetical protein